MSPGAIWPACDKQLRRRLSDELDRGVRRAHHLGRHLQIRSEDDDSYEVMETYDRETLTYKKLVLRGNRLVGAI